VSDQKPLKHQESAIVPGALPGVAPASQEEEPVADAQHEKTIDIDSELKNGTPADLPLVVVAPLAQPAIPQSPAPQSPVPTPAVASVAKSASPASQTSASFVPEGFVPAQGSSAQPVQKQMPIASQAPVVAQTASVASPPAPKVSSIHEPRSFASITPLVMREPVAPAVMQTSATPAPAPVTPPQADPQMRAPIPILQDIPGSPTPAPGTVTKQPDAPTEPKSSEKKEEPKKQTVVEQLREQTATVLHPLRTYQTDAQVRIHESNASLISVAAAEENRKARAQFVVKPAYKTMSDAPQHHYVRTLIIVICIALFLAGGIGTIAYVLIPKTVPISQQQIEINHPIAVDESVELPFGGLTHDQLMQFLTDMRDKTGLSLGLVREIYFTVPTDIGGKRLATVNEVLARLAPHVPPELTRTLDAPFLVGVHVYDGNQGFVILKTNEYERAYSAMLAWEPTMRQDLLPFMDRRPGVKLNSEIAPTSTPAKVINSAFVDVVLKNHDTRALYDDVGNIIFLYSFLDRNTILIATNDRTLGEAISRITNP
jgi:hypothetical protein